MVTVLLTALFSGWWVKHYIYIYASKFTPTRLSDKEQEVLDAKLFRLEKISGKQSSSRYLPHRKGAPLKPGPYTEAGASREISLSEKELNALIANQPEIAERVAIDLSDDLMSVKLDEFGSKGGFWKIFADRCFPREVSRSFQNNERFGGPHERWILIDGYSLPRNIFSMCYLDHPNSEIIILNGIDNTITPLPDAILLLAAILGSPPFWGRTTVTFCHLMIQAPIISVLSA